MTNQGKSRGDGREGKGRCAGKEKLQKANIKILVIKLWNRDSWEYLFSLSKETVIFTKSRLEVSKGWEQGKE